MSPLVFMKEGEKGEIVALTGPGAAGTAGGVCEHLASMGLRPGKQIEMITNRGCGPLVLRMEESHLALGRGMAMKITIRRIEE